MASGTLADLKNALALYRTFDIAGDEDGKAAILQNLGRVTTPDLQQYLLQQIFTEDIRIQDVRRRTSSLIGMLSLTASRFASYCSPFSTPEQGSSLSGSGFRSITFSFRAT